LRQRWGAGAARDVFPKKNATAFVCLHVVRDTHYGGEGNSLPPLFHRLVPIFVFCEVA